MLRLMLLPKDDDRKKHLLGKKDTHMLHKRCISIGLEHPGCILTFAYFKHRKGVSI